jgi:hypothetical protein
LSVTHTLPHSLEAVGSRESAPVLLDDLAREPRAGLHGGLEGLALHDLREEGSSEAVTGAVGVNDLVMGNVGDDVLHALEVLSLLVLGDDDGVLTLSDDGNSGSLGVDLLPLRDGDGNVHEVSIFDLVDLGEALGLIFVAENVVSMLKNSIDFISVELDQEAGREIVA